MCSIGLHPQTHLYPFVKLASLVFIMEKSFDALSEIAPGRLTWKIKVRLVRLWEVPTFLKPDQANSLEMVLVDDKGCKIQASVRKQLIYVFQRKLKEGEVYKVSFFSVVPSSGSYRAAPHPCKIVFQMTTKVQPCTSSLIPMYGLSFTSIVDVASHTVEYDFLVDVIGLVTAVSEERELVRDGNITKMVVFEITDHSGKIECALFGDYVALWKRFMANRFEGLPIVVVQFAKVKIFRDKATLQNVKSTTRLLVNPDVPEVVAFRDRLISCGVQSSTSVAVLGGRSKPSLEEDFLRMYPKKTISQLHESDEDGLFVVSAIVSGFVEGEEWFYPACKCHRSVVADSGAYYCKGCDKHVIHMVPRYKIKLRVDDGTGDSVFVLFDNDAHHLLEKPCSMLVSNSKGDCAGSYPPEIIMLKGKRYLFKVEKPVDSGGFFDGSYKVKRVCGDQSVIAKFALDGCDYTPTESISKGKLIIDESSQTLLDAGCKLDDGAGFECGAASSVSYDGVISLGDDTQATNHIGAEHLMSEFIGTPNSDDDDAVVDTDALNFPKRNLANVFDCAVDDDIERDSKARKISK